MQESYIPKIDPWTMCEVLKMCSVRKNTSGQDFVVIKKLDGSQHEVLASEIMLLDSFEGKRIERIYCSWHVFITPNCKQVYLIKISKNWYDQRQFTWWSPKEDFLKTTHYIKDGILQFDLEKIEHNAWLRTKNRTSVDVTDIYNDIPLVDRVLNENIDSETGEKYWKLVFLLHHFVKSYKGSLAPQVGVEDVSDGKWFDIEDLLLLPSISTNAYIITKAFTSWDYDKHIGQSQSFQSLLIRIDYYLERVRNHIMMIMQSSWRYSFASILVIFGIK